MHVRSCVHCVFLSVEAREQLWVLFLRLHLSCFFSETGSLTGLELIKQGKASPSPGTASLRLVLV